MAGAVIRLAAAACPVPLNVSSPASIDPAKPTVSRIGATVAAVRRTAVTALPRASMPVAPGAAASGTVSSHTSGGISTGASIAPPRTSSIATSKISEAASAEWAVAKIPASATDPPSAATPTTQRLTVIALRSTAASRSASAGRTRPARRAASHAPSSAITRPTAKATATGHTMMCAVKSGGAIPDRASQRANGGAITIPSAPPGRGGQDPHGQRLAEHETAYLAGRRPRGPQQPELTAPGGHGVGERAGHHEDRYEPGEPAGGAEQGGRHGEQVGVRVGLGVAAVVAGQHPDRLAAGGRPRLGGERRDGLTRRAGQRDRVDPAAGEPRRRRRRWRRTRPARRCGSRR